MLGERALWILIAATLFFFYRPLLGDTFFFRDVYLLFYGKKLMLAEALRHGQIPLWDPLMNGGQPFLASPGNSALYPFNILFLFLPPLAAFNVHLVLQFVCCAVSAYFLARVLGLSTIAAFVCGCVYTFCGYVLSSATLLVLMQAVPWAPALLGSIHLLVTEERKRWLVASAIFGALPILGGGADMSAMSFAIAAAWALIVPREIPIARRLKLAALAIAFSAGLSLMLTLPAYEVIRNSSRGEKRDYATFVQWSVSPQRLPELVVPRFFGPTDTLARRDYWGGKFEGGYPYMVSIYFGASVFLLALAGLTGSKLRGRFLLGAFALAGFILSLGGYLPFFHWIWEHVPLIGIFRFPVKALQLTLVPMAVLAAAGVDALCGCGLQPAHTDPLVFDGGHPHLVALGQRSVRASLDELLDDRTLRLLERFRRTLLDDLSLVEHRHAIGDLERDLHVVRDRDGRRVQLRVHLENEIGDDVADHGIESGRGLVEQQDRRLQRDRARESDAAPHASRQLGWPFVIHAAEVDLVEAFLDAPANLFFRHLRVAAQGKGDVLENRHRVEQRTFLERHPETLSKAIEHDRLHAAEVLAVDKHVTCIGQQQADDVLQRHALAGSGTTDDDDGLALFDVDRQVAQHLLAAERL